MTPATILEEERKAIILLASIKMELEAGSTHFNKAGKLLTTTEQILDTWIAEGKVTVVQKGKR